MVKNPPANAGASRDGGSIPRSGRYPGEGNGNLLQHSCFKNYPMKKKLSHGLRRLVGYKPWGCIELDMTE